MQMHAIAVDMYVSVITPAATGIALNVKAQTKNAG